jgi:large subunit ribosomal protein L31e
MAKKTKIISTEKIEREYTIPLREKCRPVPRYKKTPKAIKTVKEFIVRHMQIRNRDLKKVKLDMYLNELLWQRGIKKPLHKVKVKAVKEGDIVKVYAIDLPTKLNFKKIRQERQEVEQKKEAKEVKENQKSMMEKAKESIKGSKDEGIEEDKNKDDVEDKVAEKEKKEAVKEVAKIDSKEDAKEVKKTTDVKVETEKAKEEETKK